MTRLLLWGILGGLICATATAQPAKRLSLIGHLPYTDLLNDIWGYVAPDGTEYALVGLRNGVSIVSLQNPAVPEERFFIPGPSSVWRDLKTFGPYAYVSNETAGGILIIDLTLLPDTILTREVVIEGVTTLHNLWIADGFLYGSGPNRFNGGLLILDLNANPWNPVFAGAYSVRYVHDVYVRDSLAFAAEIYDGRLTVLDIRDKTAPQIMSSVAYRGGFTHNTWLSDNGLTCFTTDELRGGKVRSWDVTDPLAPVELDYIRSSLSNPQEVIPHNVHVKNDYLVTSYYRDGVHLVDASRPHNLLEVGFFDTSPLEGEGFNGCWGAYPFLPSGLVLASDIEEGLYVLQPDYQRACFLEGKVTDAATGQPIPHARIEFVDRPLAEPTFSGEAGAYATGQADEGAYRVRAWKYGYLPDTFLAELRPGAVLLHDFLLSSVPRADFTLWVRSQADGSPLAQAQVKLQGPEPEAFFKGETDELGRVFFPAIPQNPYEIVAGKWGFHARLDKVGIGGAGPTHLMTLQTGYRDEFALDLGWETEGDAIRGLWVRDAPIRTRYQGWTFNPGSDLEGDIGDKCYLTGNAGGLPFGDDVDEGYVLLISPWVDLRSYRQPLLTYHYWFVNYTLANGGGQANDFFSISATNGVDTVEFARYLGPFDTLWAAQPPVDLRALIGGDSLRFLFYTQDYFPLYIDAVEAAVDGFEVLEGNLAPPGRAVLTLYALPGEQAWVSYRFAEQASPPYSLSIFDLAGRLLGKQLLHEASGTARLPDHYPGGVYLLQPFDRTQAGPAIKWIKR